MSFTISKKGALPDSEFEIEGEIHADAVKESREDAVKSISSQMKVDGFRPGHIPEKVVVDRIGEMEITEEAGRIALEKHYDAIIREAKISSLGQPQVTITKVAPGEAFGFKIKTAVMPEVTIPDYKKIAKEIMKEDEKIEVEEKEIDATVEDLRKQIAHNDHHAANPDDHGHDHAELPLPEVNEEFIKKFGSFENIEAFRARIKEGILAEKTRKARDIKRLKIMEALIEKSKVSMPKLLIQSELNKMVSEMDANIQQMGLDMETYLKHINKTIEQMREDWHIDAEKRAKTQLILNQIAIDAKLEVAADDLNREVDQIIKMYPDANKNSAAIYVETILLNEKAWQLLEAK
jgi:FKBP-type peptidyl-prolyl cis-trans isomerase (trigger factor)